MIQAYDLTVHNFYRLQLLNQQSLYHHKPFQVRNGRIQIHPLHVLCIQLVHIDVYLIHFRVLNTAILLPED